MVGLRGFRRYGTDADFYDIYRTEKVTGIIDTANHRAYEILLTSPKFQGAWLVGMVDHDEETRMTASEVIYDILHLRDVDISLAYIHRLIVDPSFELAFDNMLLKGFDPLPFDQEFLDRIDKNDIVDMFTTILIEGKQNVLMKYLSKFLFNDFMKSCFMEAYICVGINIANQLGINTALTYFDNLTSYFIDPNLPDENELNIDMLKDVMRTILFDKSIIYNGGIGDYVYMSTLLSFRPEGVNAIVFDSMLHQLYTLYSNTKVINKTRELVTSALETYQELQTHEKMSVLEDALDMFEWDCILNILVPEKDKHDLSILLEYLKKSYTTEVPSRLFDPISSIERVNINDDLVDIINSSDEFLSQLF